MRSDAGIPCVNTRVPAPPEMLLSNVRRFLPADRTVSLFAVASVVLALLVFLAERQARVTGEWVVHTVEVREAIRGVTSGVRAAESIQRAFLVAATEHFFADYARTRASVMPSVDRLVALVRFNQVQHERAGQLKHLVAERMRLLDENLDRARNGRLDDAIRTIRDGEGTSLMDRLVATADMMDAEEVHLLAERSALLARQRFWETATAVSLVVFCGLLLYIAERRARRDRVSRAALAASEKRYRGVVTAMNEGVIIVDAEGRIQEANAAAERILGLSQPEMAGRASGDARWRTVREDGAPFPAEEHPSIRALASGGAVRDVVMGVHRPNGSLVWILINAEPIRGGDREAPAGAITTFTDITRQIEQNAETRRARTQLAHVLEGSNDGFWDWHVPSGGVTYSPRWAQMLGYDVAELAPNLTTWQRLIHPDDEAVVAAVLDPHLRGESEQYECEHRLRHKDGHWVWVLDRGRVVERAPDGSPIRASGTHTGITARKNAEAAREAAQAETERLVAELREAVQSVRTLSGLLPICMHCKKVRDDEGYWKRIDEYIALHTEASITHGVCPECEAAFYSEPASAPEQR